MIDSKNDYSTTTPTTTPQSFVPGHAELISAVLPVLSYTRANPSDIFLAHRTRRELGHLRAALVPLCFSHRASARHLKLLCFEPPGVQKPATHDAALSFPARYHDSVRATHLAQDSRLQSKGNFSSAQLPQDPRLNMDARSQRGRVIATIR